MKRTHIKGFKQEVNAKVANPKKIYKGIESQVYEKRYLDLYGLDAHCYDCHKPIKIDSRTILKNHNMTNTALFCDEHKSEGAKYGRDPVFIKHKNTILTIFKNTILEDSVDKLPNFIKNIGL